MYNFTCDIDDLITATRSGSIAAGLDVLGPHERVIGSTNHVYRRVEHEIFVHIQNFRIVEPYVYRFVRRGYVTLQFVLSGSYQLGLPRRMHQFRAGTLRINGFPQSETHLSAGGKPVIGVCLMVQPAFLIHELGLVPSRVPKTYRALFDSPNGADLSMELPLTPAMWLAVEQIVECDLTEPLRGVFLNAKALELACHVVARLNLLRPATQIVGVSRETREQQLVDLAETIYRYELERPPSIDELARRIGLNKNRLTSAFRERFGATPGQYSREARLQWAHQCLMEQSGSVAEIAATVGYDSAAAFSRAFAERYGYAPSAARGDGGTR